MNKLLVFAALAGATQLEAQAASTRTTPSADILRLRAESTYASGDRVAAARAYAALLAVETDDSRALFRLAGLQTRTAARVSLLERYVALEPSDAWGWLALAEVWSAAGNTPRADVALTRAERIAPSERDVRLARARALGRAGQTDAAIMAYESLVRRETTDVEAWQGLAEQRRRAGRMREGIDALARVQSLRPSPRHARQLTRWKEEAGPQFEPAFAVTRDSDANITERVSIALRPPLADRTAITFGASTLSARNPIDFAGAATAQSGFISARARPRAALQTDVTIGATQVSTARPAGTSGSVVRTTTPTGLARLRWRGALHGPSLDIRASRAQLDVTPLLVSNRVVQSEGSVAMDVPMPAGLRIRATGRAAAITSPAERQNARIVAGAALVRPMRGWGEIVLSGQRITLARATTQGYFAPRSAQLAELSTYVEHESERGIVLAMELGAGLQRVHTFKAGPPGTWQPAGRLWTHLDVPVHPRVLLRSEIDLYDGAVARVAASAAHWRSMSAAIGLRLTP